MTEKDIKLLWGRAANRCSICRLELSQDKRATSGSFTLGEQAHIVGEKESAPRGKSPLSVTERNSYHNMILVCPNHHTEIDASEPDWPVEKLHYAKSTHELWVRETLSDSTDRRLIAKQIAVTSIIDAAVELCRLEDWKNWTRSALAPIPVWQSDLPDMLFEFRQRVAAAIWPSEYEELKRATTTLAIFLHDAAETFMRHSVRRTEETYWADQFYKSNGFNPNYDKDLHRFNKWLDDCYRLITKAACAANWFADVVRRDINPMFFAERGKFIIVDGPFPDLSYRASIPEFGEDEKKDFPQSLTQ